MLLLLILSALFSNTVARAPPVEEYGNQVDQLCGQVITASGKIIILKEGIPLTDADFENVHIEKISGAQLNPITESSCAINICGFTSWGHQISKDYIGTTSDYSDCQLITRSMHANKAIYNEKFNTSALSCGCTKSEEDCMFVDCDERKSTTTWRDNECAILFQEENCGTCYLPPVTLSNGEKLSTNHSLHFYGAVVRDNCYLQQQVSAFARMWRFHTIKQPILHQGGWAGPLISAYQNDPEIFTCFCGVPLTVSNKNIIPRPPASSPEKINNDDNTHLLRCSNFENNTIEKIVVLLAGTVFVAIVFAGFLFWKLVRWFCNVPKIKAEEKPENPKTFLSFLFQ